MNSKKILFVSHDANRAGGQIFLLNIMQYFHKQGWQMHLLLLAGGVLENEFAKICEVSLFPQIQNKKIGFTKKFLQKIGIDYGAAGQALEIELLNITLKQNNFDLIYINTIAAAWVMPKLEFLKIPILVHIHELGFSLQMYAKPSDRAYLFKNSQKIIACSTAVADNLIETEGVSANKIQTIHSFIDNEGIQKRIENTDKQGIATQFNLPYNKFLVGGCGNAEWRKGLDIFILVAKKALILNPALHFVWVGISTAGELYEKMLYDIQKLGISDNISLIAPTSASVEILSCIDVFTLVSREDPFPLVMLEAALAKKPIITFAATGGGSEFVENNAGFIVPYLSIAEMADKINELSKNTALCKNLGEAAHKKILEKYSLEQSIQKIYQTIENI